MYEIMIGPEIARAASTEGNYSMYWAMQFVGFNSSLTTLDPQYTDQKTPYSQYTVIQKEKGY